MLFVASNHLEEPCRVEFLEAGKCNLLACTVAWHADFAEQGCFSSYQSALLDAQDSLQGLRSPAPEAAPAIQVNRGLHPIWWDSLATICESIIVLHTTSPRWSLPCTQFYILYTHGQMMIIHLTAYLGCVCLVYKQAGARRYKT